MKQAGSGLSDRARCAHADNLVIDGCFPMHTGPLGYSENMTDQARRMIERGATFSEVRAVMSKLYDDELKDGSCDLWEWLKASGVTAFNTTVGKVEGSSCQDAFDSALRELAVWHRRFDTYDSLIKVTRSTDIERAKAESKWGVILGFQNSTHFMNDLGNVELFYGLGIRIVQLTYNLRNRAGDGCTEPSNAGLSHFGRRLVKKLNQMRILVDVSHCGEATCRDTIEASGSPVAITHTSCKAIYDHVRAKSDDLLRMIGAANGYVGILLIPWFIAAGQPSIDDFVDHVVHAASIVGVDKVGIGTDLNSFPPEMRAVNEREKLEALKAHGVTGTGWREGDFQIPQPELAGYRDWRDFPRLTEAMLRRNLGEQEIRGILGRNFVRIFRDSVD